MLTFLAFVFFNWANQASFAYLVNPTISLPTGVDKLRGWTPVSVTVSSFVLGIFTFLYYATEESDDIITRSTETVKY